MSTQYYATILEGPPHISAMPLWDKVVFWKTHEEKEAAKKGFRMRSIFDLLLFSILTIIAITIGL
ncbi:MAG: hypothetical protein CMB68_00680 [Euryarchaeota archaeon]|nr:hypothetical protein [Euryarchaeota archaeon]